jgi:cephalosporin-C deacetylase-like acetyl esterase
MVVFRGRQCLLVIVLCCFSWVSGNAQQLPGTDPLTLDGDLAVSMVAGIDSFAMHQLEASVDQRASRWKLDFSSREAFLQSIKPNRDHFRQIIGAIDTRIQPVQMELVARTDRSAVVGRGKTYSVTAVRWPVLEGVQGVGLLLTPQGKIKAQVIALTDADQSPESLAGLDSGASQQSQFATYLAENGCEVLISLLIDRADTWSGNPRVRMTNQPHREFVYRMASEVGRHIIGYEVQKVLSAVDYFKLKSAEDKLPVGVIGYGEGGLLALYSGAVDERIDVVCVSGYFQSREEVWREPIYRNVWGLLDEFGDAEIAHLICPRPLVVEASRGPEISGPPPVREGRDGAAPGRLVSPPLDSTRTEFKRAQVAYVKLAKPDAIRLVGGGSGQHGSMEALNLFLSFLGFQGGTDLHSTPPTNLHAAWDPASRMQSQVSELCEFTQKLVRQSESRRAEFMRNRFQTPPARWDDDTAQRYRDLLWDEIIGRFPAASLPPRPRTRRVFEQEKWVGYEVVLDVWPDVYAYGILLVPRDLKDGERRPVVVCQHGLEGRPQVICDPKAKSVYHAFGANLADRGFIVFAPQNPYIGKDNFRVLQRKLNPLKKSLFSVIVRQHERILEWLAQLPFVDPTRIGFYGLSYGGMTAMRIPALLKGYSLSISSGAFNEWILKSTSLDFRYSYIFTGEYEMVDFNLGNTFNHFEMAALIAPRPFMVERGHRDAVAPDEWVAYEYAKVRRLYDELGIPGKTKIEFFNGGHEIHAKGTFEFLAEHLNWPEK